MNSELLESSTSEVINTAAEAHFYHVNTANTPTSGTAGYYPAGGRYSCTSVATGLLNTSLKIAVISVMHLALVGSHNHNSHNSLTYVCIVPTPPPSHLCSI